MLVSAWTRSNHTGVANTYIDKRQQRRERERESDRQMAPVTVVPPKNEMCVRTYCSKDIPKYQ